MMRKTLVIMRYLTSTICIIILLWGCGRAAYATTQPKVVRKKVVAQNEQISKVRANKTIIAAKTTGVTTKPRVIRKKVVAQKEQTTQVSRNKTIRPTKIEQAGQFDEKTAAAGTDKSQAKAISQTAPDTKTDGKTLIAKKIGVIPTSDTVNKLPAVRPVSDLSEIKQPATNDIGTPSDKLIAATSYVTPKTRAATIPKGYDAIGKIDPFEPLFREKQVSVSKKKKKKDQKKRIPRTPLERIDLSQLKLVGIILASSGNRALVEESSGKGYVIKKGTYIGMNSGKVINIKKEKVVVEEEFEDVFGKSKLRQREIKLPKPPGEF
jgi:type IV pilus assembly protein PilP